jgi:hypothetical protein
MAGADPLYGGGILNSGLATIVNTTISDNATNAIYGGGGLANTKGGTVTIINSTITANSTSPSQFQGHGAADGGGLAIEDGATVTLVNTIVAGNENGDCRQDANSVAPISGGHNLDGDGNCALSGPWDISGADPLLSPLADNGGPTLTHALMDGSPAIDAGDDGQCPDTDQRDAQRPVGGACDIGAYEDGGIVPPHAGPPRGDVDCDGAVTVLDAVYVLWQAGTGYALPGCEGTGDVDCDGDVDLEDALLILNLVAGLEVAPCVTLAGQHFPDRSGCHRIAGDCMLGRVSSPWQMHQSSRT